MGLPKGQTNNKKGRPKGSRNKSTKELRAIITSLFEEQIDQIREDLAELEPRYRLKFLTDLLPYVIPRLQNITQTNVNDIDSLTGEQLDQVVDSILNNNKAMGANLPEWMNEGE